MKNCVKQMIFKRCCNKVNALRLLTIAVCLILESFIASYREQQILSYTSIEKTMHFMDELKKDSNKLKFISDHLFTLNKVNFEDFVKNITRKQMVQILSINKDEINIGSITKDTFVIRALFWHDAYIFDFLDDIYSFNSGFARILELNIAKIAAVSNKKPVMEAEIKCEVFHLK
jgi:hypothetical protein